MNIVLVHGILGFGRIGPVDYFNGVADHLRKRFGASVFAPALNPTAGTKTRSIMLRQSIQDALSGKILDAAQPVHIIAHSMGGLDARRLISESPFIKVGGSVVPVKSLATIGTPHRGSPVADVVALKFVPQPALLVPVFEAAKAALGDVANHFGISLEGLNDLTSAAAIEFNKEVRDHKDVNYFSFAGEGRSGLLHTSGFFVPYHAFMRLATGEANDGVVSVSSAKWAGFDPKLWPCDHADEIGHNLDGPLQPPDQATLDRYAGIVERF